MNKLERIDRVELMRTFVRIIEAGSLSAAAVRMKTTQATISRRLQSLETLLGTKLLLRSTHAMKLTDDGERCYQHAKKVIDAWLALEEELHGAEEDPVGVLKVRAPHAFGQQQLLTPLVSFLQRYPGLAVEWMLNDKTVDFLSDDIDCAIRVGGEVDVTTVSVLLAEVPRSIVAAPELLARYPQISHPVQMSAMPWIAVSTFYRHEIVVTQADTGERSVVAIQPRLSTDSLYVARNTALAGLGLALVSSWTVEEELAGGQLVEVLPHWQAAALPVHLVYPWARYYPTRLRTFLALMREVMPGVTGMRLPESL
ncbi:LysR family transcriptional regulator [Klebsiella sp. RIT-PI-d]|uniref:LysR family transcriptional regulator n=1 Tax=Klebsiella sp. RIT-PI-d TaxID=1681196 RepID=UPI00067604F4|nr:LysR family transcriptional regulator [Klebsiella sp. RIT-PI-d]KNC09034.1 LysR family transcriptional regulator [Klebsiella sp. RIT-PI-d]